MLAELLGAASARATAAPARSASRSQAEAGTAPARPLQAWRSHTRPACDRRRRPAFVVVRASRRRLHEPCSARKARLRRETDPPANALRGSPAAFEALSTPSHISNAHRTPAVPEGPVGRVVGFSTEDEGLTRFRSSGRVAGNCMPPASRCGPRGRGWRTPAGFLDRHRRRHREVG